MTKNYCIEIVKMQLHSISIHFDISNDIVSNIIIIDWFQRCENNCTKMKLFVITHNKKKTLFRFTLQFNWQFFFSMTYFECWLIDAFFFSWKVIFLRFEFVVLCKSSIISSLSRIYNVEKHSKSFHLKFLFFYANYYQLQQNECSHLYDELKFFNTNEFKIVFQKKFNNKYSKISWNFSLLFKSILHKY